MATVDQEALSAQPDVERPCREVDFNDYMVLRQAAEYSFVGAAVLFALVGKGEGREWKTWKGRF